MQSGQGHTEGDIAYLARLAIFYVTPFSLQVGPSTGTAAIGGPFILTSHENKMVSRLLFTEPEGLISRRKYVL
jgi:hypothetical protein